ncbi:MAG: hypothetical protein RL527_1946 [Planctomycetota bacterium]
MIEFLTVGFFVIACLLAVRNTAWALALVVSMYALEQALQASSGIFMRITPLANVCVAVAAGLSVVLNLPSQDRPFRGYATPIFSVALGFFVWAMISLLWTPAFEAAWGLTRWGIPYVILFLMVAPLLIDGMASLDRFFRAFLILGSITTILILINPAFTVKLGRLGVDLDATVRTNPLVIGELGGLMILVAALAPVDGSAPKAVLARLVAFGLGGVLSLQSGSRGQLIFALGLAVIAFPFARRIRNIAGFFGTVAAVALMIPLVLFLAQLVLGTDELRRWELSTLVGGANTRVLNILDLFAAFANRPSAWVVGLGFNAFSWVSGANKEPYSHALVVDMLTELGIPAFVVFCWWSLRVLQDGLWLLRRFGDDDSGRATASLLMVLFVYETLLVNKQGYLWAATLFFLVGIAITRVRVREEALDAEYAEDPGPGNGAHADVDNHHPADGRLAT